MVGVSSLTGDDGPVLPSLIEGRMLAAQHSANGENYDCQPAYWIEQLLMSNHPNIEGKRA